MPKVMYPQILNARLGTQSVPRASDRYEGLLCGRVHEQVRVLALGP